MCSYKIRLKSGKSLCKAIEKNASVINSNLAQINEAVKKNSSLIRELKKNKIASGKLDVQFAKPKKETKELKNLYKTKIKQISSLNNSLLKNYIKMINLIKDTAHRLDKATYDADSLIFREDHRISILVKRLIEKKQSHKMIFKLNMLKGLIKTTALRLFEASKFQQKSVLKYPSEVKEVGFASKIKELSAKIWNLEKTLEKEGAENIDNLIKESKEELDYLKKLELDILMIMPLLEKYLIDFENDAYLLEENYSKNLADAVSSAKNVLKKIKEKISERAQKLFEEIELIAESK